MFDKNDQSFDKLLWNGPIEDMFNSLTPGIHKKIQTFLFIWQAYILVNYYKLFVATGLLKQAWPFCGHQVLKG